MSTSGLVACAVRRDDNLAVFNQLSIKEIENLVASISKTQVQRITDAIIGRAQDELWIGITDNMSSSRRAQVDGRDVRIGDKLLWPCKLIDILHPICFERLTQAFSVSSQFVQSGIVFDFLNLDKSGILDHVEDASLKEKISSGMRGKTTFYVTLKVEVENGLIFKIERYLDGEWVHSERAEVEYFVHRALLGMV